MVEYIKGLCKGTQRYMGELHQEKLIIVTYFIATLCGSTITWILLIHIEPLHPIVSGSHDSEHLEAALDQLQSLRTKSLMNSTLWDTNFPPLLN